MEKHHNNFDLIRLIAAMQVAYVHLLRDLRLPTFAAVDWLAVMFPGVAVFFVISGYLVTKSFTEGGNAVWPYVLKRALRIYPGLWINFILILPLVYWAGALSPADVLSWKFLIFQIGQFIFGEEAYGRVFAGPIYHWGQFYPAYPNPASWTIPVELGFYVLVPLTLGALAGRRRAVANGLLLCMIAVSLALAVLSAHWLAVAPHSLATGALGNGPLPYFWMFLLGAGAYLNWDRLRSWFEGRLAAWFAVYFLVQALCVVGFDRPDVDFIHITALAVLKVVLLAGVVLAFAHSYKGLASILRGNDFSYGLYLYHMPLFWTLMGFGLVQRAYLWPVCFGGAFALAALSWFLIERRCLRLKPSSTRKLPEAPAATAAAAAAAPPV
ncbi:MAG TPA: acyltransferase [Stellaceae bacterium]|nr:acyltransferase [Stellaceae bacterium]